MTDIENSNTEKPDFGWVEIYRKIAEKLIADYREEVSGNAGGENPKQQARLIELLQKIQQKKIETILSRRHKNKRKEVPSQIDPFSFFANFNRESVSNRAKIIKEIWEFFSFQEQFPGEKLPDNFDGATHAAATTWYSYFWFHSQKDAVKNLWTLASQAVDENVDNDLLAQCFEMENLGIVSLTMGLYWFCPNQFLPLDKVSRTFLRTKKITIPRSTPDARRVPKGRGEDYTRQYRKFLSAVRHEYPDRDPKRLFPELTLQAFTEHQKRENSKTSNKTMPNNNTPPRRLPPPIDEITAILDHKKQVILYGPPGTGKTYWANEYVKHFITERFKKERDIPDITEEHKKEFQEYVDTYVRRCTFHPEYGYEHFIEGFKPEIRGEGDKGGQMVFDLDPGIFKKLCDEARKDMKNKYYLIIDEINRGDIPRIFGELITLIESDKRKLEFGVSLPHSGNKDKEECEKFYVPPNVYIIATMNTADRSIALLDTALRRRFGFLEMKPDASVFGTNDVNVKVPKGGTIELKKWFKELNGELKKALTSRHDVEHIMIGHSYFLPTDKLGKRTNESSDSPTIFEQIIKYEILPLVQEYCYEDKTARETLEKHIYDTTGVYSTDKPPKDTQNAKSAETTATEATGDSLT